MFACRDFFFYFLPNKLKSFKNPADADADVGKLGDTDPNERSLQNVSQVQTLKTHSYNHIITARTAAQPLTANALKAGIRGAPRPAGGRPPGWCLKPPLFPEQIKANVFIPRLHSRRPHLCCPRVSAARPKSKICAKTCLTSGKMTIFLSPSFYFAAEAQGGAGRAGLNIPTGRGEKCHYWCCDFITTCARALWARGDAGRAAGAEPCRAACGLPGDRQATFFGLPQNKLLHIGCTILAARCSHDEL